MTRWRLHGENVRLPHSLPVCLHACMLMCSCIVTGKHLFVCVCVCSAFIHTVGTHLPEQRLKTSSSQAKCLFYG